jgi:rubrerythrin
MKTEQDKTLEGLKIAVQMEIDGKEYYLQASQKAINELGKKLLVSLAAEEDVHRQKFEELFNAIRNNKDWPVTDFQPDGGKGLRTIFAMTAGETDTKGKGSETELDTIQKAMNMEGKTYDFYQSRGKEAAYDAERNFYQLLAAEEREHQLILLDYYEYLNDPAGWFIAKEHPSLDAG